MRWIYFLSVFLVATLPFAGQAEIPDICEIVVDSDGTTALVPCCRLKIGLPSNRVGRPDVVANAAPTDASLTDDSCSDLQMEVEMDSLENLQKVLRDQSLNTVAQFLRRRPQTGLGAFTVEQPFYQFISYCCSCIPNQTCSADIPSDVCTRSDDGTCPSDTIKTVCTIGASGTDDVCTGID